MILYLIAVHPCASTPRYLGHTMDRRSREMPLHGMDVQITHSLPSRWDAHVALQVTVTKECERCHRRRKFRRVHRTATLLSHTCMVPGNKDADAVDSTPVPSYVPRYTRAWLAYLNRPTGITCLPLSEQTQIPISYGLGSVFGAHERRCDRWWQ